VGEQLNQNNINEGVAYTIGGVGLVEPSNSQRSETGNNSPDLRQVWREMQERKRDQMQREAVIRKLELSPESVALADFGLSSRNEDLATDSVNISTSDTHGFPQIHGDVNRFDADSFEDSDNEHNNNKNTLSGRLLHTDGDVYRSGAVFHIRTHSREYDSRVSEF